MPAVLSPHSPPGHREEPYVTEAGREAFDRLCRLHRGELQVLGGGLPQAARPVLVTEQELVKDALNVLIGVVSATFPLCQVRALARGHGAARGCFTGSPPAGWGEACPATPGVSSFRL